MKFSWFPKGKREKKPVDLGKRRRMAATVNMLSSMSFLLLLYTWLSGITWLNDLIWAVMMVLIPLENILRDVDTYYMKFMMGTAIVLIIETGVRMIVPVEYVVPVNMLDLFLTVLIVITYFHKFFDRITESLVSSAKKMLGSGR